MSKEVRDNSNPSQPKDCKAVKVWRLVDKDGNPAPVIKLRYFETETGATRKVEDKPLNLGERIREANETNPDGAPHKYQCFISEKALTQAERVAQHWKANHDAQVEKARVLIDRPDLPLERVRAYKTIGRLQDEVSNLMGKLNTHSAISKTPSK